MLAAREFVLFGLAGTIGYGIDVGTLYLIFDSFGRLGGRVISLFVAASATWAFNKFFTFRLRPARIPIHAEYMAYISLMIIGALINFTVYACALAYMENLPLFLAVAAGSLSGMGVNFTLARKLVYKTSDQISIKRTGR